MGMMWLSTWLVEAHGKAVSLRHMGQDIEAPT